MAISQVTSGAKAWATAAMPRISDVEAVEALAALLAQHPEHQRADRRAHQGRG